MTITLTREEAQEVLYALTYVGDAKDIYSDIIETLRTRLAQPESEYKQCEYNSGTCKRRGCAAGCQAIKLCSEKITQPDPKQINYEEWNYDPMTGKPLWDEQPEPTKSSTEPVAWAYEFGTDYGDAVNEIRWHRNVHLTKPTGMVRNVVPLYAAPPRE